MHRHLKKFFTLIGALALLILLGIGLSAWLISPNRFKPEITEAFKKHTGRNLTIEGDLQLAFFPWLAVTAENVSVSNASGFSEQPFAKLAKVNASLNVLSLFKKQFEVNQVVVTDLDLHLTTNAKGINNWSDFGATQTTSAQSASSAISSKTTSAIAVFASGGINIQNSHVRWDDQQASQNIDIQALNLTTSQFVFNKPIPTHLSLIAVNNKTLAKQTFQLTGDLIINDQLDAFSLIKPAIKIAVAGDEYPNKQLEVFTTAANVEFNPSQQTVKILSLLVNTADIAATSDLSITNFLQKPTAQGLVKIAAFNPGTALKAFGISVPVLQDKQALSSLTVNANLKATSDDLELQNMTLKLDDSTITGHFNLKNFAQPAVQFNLAIDQINADRYLTAETKQTANSLASPAVSLAAAFSVLPKETLQKLDASGELILNKLTVNDLTMQDIRLNITAKNGSVKTSQSAQKFYQGDYEGSMDVSVSNGLPLMAVSEKINHVQLQPLLQDMHYAAKISGLIDATSQLSTQGNTEKQLKSALNGSLHFLIKDSVITGFNLQNLIDSGKTLLQNKQPLVNKNEQTLFSVLSGSAIISQGIIQSNDLTGSAAKLQLTGKGSADLNSQQLDVKLNAKFSEAASATQVPALAINVTGPFGQPSYQFEVAALLKDKNTVKVLENVVEHNKDKIDKLLNKLDPKTSQKALDLLKKIF